jgi:signal transduction histidine kinase
VEPSQPDGVNVVRRLPTDLPTVVASRDKLKQVLINLCKNALEAMPDGGELHVEASHLEEAVVIRITDTGVGIRPDTDVFVPFESTKPQGTGLGLPIARQIVVAHGGHLDYESVPGEGTTFTLMLPRRSPPSDP